MQRSGRARRNPLWRPLPSLLVALFCLATTTVVAIAAEFDIVRTGLPHDALYDIAFDGRHGLAVGAYGVVLASEDGGETWRPLESGVEDALLGATTAGCSADLIVGQQGLILRREDGGAWRRVDSGSAERLFAVACDDEGLAFAVGGFGTVLMSTDTGRSWSQVVFDWQQLTGDVYEPHLYAVAISAEGEVLIGGEFALILGSDDHGATWERRHSGDASIFDFHLRADGSGYAVGQDGLVLKSADHGSSWQMLETASVGDHNLLSVLALPGGQVAVAGTRTLATSDDGGVSWWRSQSPLVRTSWYVALDAASGSAAPAAVFAVGERGTIIKVPLAEQSQPVEETYP